MKSRLAIWLMLTAIAATVAIAIWFGRPHSSGAKIEPPKNPSASQPVAAARTASTKLPAFAPLPPAKVNPVAELSAGVKTIIDGLADYRERKSAVHRLNANLADSDRDALYGYLRQHDPLDDRQTGQVLKNELLDELCRMEPPPAGLRELLTQIYQDSSQNIVLRDYAVQHLSAFYRQMASAADVDPQARDDDLNQARQMLWQALNETGSSIAGTALLGLSQLSQEGWSGLDSDKINQAALKLAGDSSASELTRITAFQVCATQGVKEALPFVLGAAQQAETESLRISAIAAVGVLGGGKQEPLLNSILQGDDERLKLPAQRALNQIEQRLRQQASAKSN